MFSFFLFLLTKVSKWPWKQRQNLWHFPPTCWDLGCKDKNILKIIVRESLEGLEEIGTKQLQQIKRVYPDFNKNILDFLGELCKKTQGIWLWEAVPEIWLKEIITKPKFIYWRVYKLILNGIIKNSEKWTSLFMKSSVI